MTEYHNPNEDHLGQINQDQIDEIKHDQLVDEINQGDESHHDQLLDEAHHDNPEHSHDNPKYNEDHLEENLDQNRASDRAMLTGMFRDRESTENAYNTLHERGYTKDEINLVMSDETREKYFSDDVKDTEIGTKAAEGAGKGSAIGGTVGAIAGVIAALGTSLVIPGLGIIIAGPIAAGLAGAGAGGVTGGIIGALVGSGIPEARAQLYESGIKDGQIVIGVQPRNVEDAEYLEENWRSNNAEEIQR